METLNMERFKDNSKTIYSFQHEFLVRCPRCNSCSIVRRIEPDNSDWFAHRRFSCLVCGSTKDWSEREITRPWYSAPVDDYFHYPLWLQTSCCGQTLWTYNLQHLDFIEAFVRAELRERKQKVWLVESQFIFKVAKMDAISQK